MALLLFEGTKLLQDSRGTAGRLVGVEGRPAIVNYARGNVFVLTAQILCLTLTVSMIVAAVLVARRGARTAQSVDDLYRVESLSNTLHVAAFASALIGLILGSLD